MQYELIEKVAGLAWQVRCIATTAVAAEGPESVASDKSVAGRLLSRIFNTDDPVFQEIQCGIVAALRLLLLEKVRSGLICNLQL
jgi:hypothetical protein